MSCDSCIDQAKERMRDLDNIRQKARRHAKEQKQALAICKEGDSGNYFVCLAGEAIANACMIVEIVSGIYEDD